MEAVIVHLPLASRQFYQPSVTQRTTCTLSNLSYGRHGLALGTAAARTRPPPCWAAPVPTPDGLYPGHRRHNGKPMPNTSDPLECLLYAKLRTKSAFSSFAVFGGGQA